VEANGIDSPLIVADIACNSGCSLVGVMDNRLIRSICWLGLLQGYNYWFMPTQLWDLVSQGICVVQEDQKINLRLPRGC
jgi:hypothetical protein